MIPAPHGLRTYVTYCPQCDTPNEWLDVLAIDEDGLPLVVHPDGDARLVTPGEIDGVREWHLDEGRPESRPVPAGPGWHVLGLIHADDLTEPERYPVVAWSVAQAGDLLGEGFGATIIAPDESSMFIPLDAGSWFKHGGNTEMIGFFHPEHFPEPADLAGWIKTRRDRYLVFKERRDRYLVSPRLPNPETIVMNAGANGPVNEIPTKEKNPNDSDRNPA